MTTAIKSISKTLIAALLISSAAICAAGQSGKSGKQAARDLPTATPDAPKQNTRDVDKAEGAKSRIESAVEPAQYSYEFRQPNFLITHILIEHDAGGRGQITFERRDGDPIVDPIEISSAANTRIRGLWDALHFLDSDKSYQAEKDYPHLGTMWLQMKQGTRQRTSEFNWTSEKNAFDLVTEYKRIANQAIFVFDITLARENQPLEAPKLMQQLDDYLRRGEVSDPQDLLPLLRELSTDERIPLMARNHAARLMKKVEK